MSAFGQADRGTIALEVRRAPPCLAEPGVGMFEDAPESMLNGIPGPIAKCT